MGDSWTNATDSYADWWNTNYPGVTLNKIAFGGWTIADLQANVAAAAALRPKTISILIGINDIASLGQSGLTVVGNAQSLVTNLKSAIPGVFVFVSTIPPSNFANGVNAARAVANPLIRAGSGVWHDGVNPIGDFIAVADTSDATLFNNGSAPGHPQPGLQALMGQIFSAVINPFYAGATASSPSQFTFPDVPGAPLSHAYVQFASAPLTGMRNGVGATAVHTDTGTFQIGRDGTSDASSKTVYNGDWLAVSATSSGTYPPATSVDNTITIGSTADTFRTTTGPLASDDFNRANGAPGTTPVGGLTWVGNGVISSNQLILGQAAGGYSAVNPGVQDVDFTMDVIVSASGTGTPVVFFGATRTGSGNTMAAFTEYYIADLTAGLCRVHTTGGALVTHFSFTALARGATYTIRVISKVSTRTITLYSNGTQIGTGVYANDPNWIPDGTWIGLYEPNINALNGMDNLSIVAAS